MRLNYPILLVALVVALPHLGHAQSDQLATIAGIVSEKASGEAVISGTVILQLDSASTPGKQIRGAITNRFGFYTIANVMPGAYFITVRSIGHRTLTQPVRIEPSGNSIRLDIQVETQEVRGQEVTVEADRNEVSGTAVSTVALDPGFIRQLPALGGETDIFRALQLLPGVQSVSEISSGLYVRGGSPDQNLTLLDGVIVYNPSHLGGFLSTFNSDAVRDITLIKGAFPAQYGGRLSSVLDLTMREGTKEKISGAAGISLINTRLTVEGPISDRATFMLSGRRMYLDLILLAAADPDEVPQYYFYDFNGKVNYRLSESDRIYASGYFGRDVLNAPPAINDPFNISWGNATGNLRWMHIVSPELFTNFSAIFTDYTFQTEFIERDYRDSVNFGFKSISGVRDYMIRGEAQYVPHQDHVIRAGLEVTEHRFRADATADVRDFGRIDRNPTILRSLDAALYAQDEWQITTRLAGNLGGRLYYFERGGYVRLEPRVSLAYDLTENIKLKGAFASANQFLHLIVRNDISLPTDVWFPSTETIKPSESLQGVIGLETTMLEGYLVTLEGYYKTMDHLLEYRDTATILLDVPIEGSFTSGSGKAYGLELFFNKRVGEFTGWLGYTLAWTQRTFPELNFGKTFNPRYDRRHDISLVLSYRIGESWELGATWVYGTGQAYTMPTGTYGFPGVEQSDNTIDMDYPQTYRDYTERNGYRLPAFHKMDLNFMHSFSWFKLPWQLSINIYNAYNHKNVFAQYVSSDYVQDPATGDYYEKPVLKRITLFPFLPTVGLSFKF